jgi:hypothetical protein
MAAFTDDEYCNFQWDQLDVQAIVAQSGLAVIGESLRSECSAWLQKNNYQTVPIDCTRGLSVFPQLLGDVFRWEQMFGYKLEEGRLPSLDALKDGFQFRVPAEGGLVLELFRPDLIWREEKDFLLGMLDIACGHSLRHLACGRRFFTLLVLPNNSPMIGETVFSAKVPKPSNDLFKEPGWRARIRRSFPSPGTP